MDCVLRFLFRMGGAEGVLCLSGVWVLRKRNCFFGEFVRFISPPRLTVMCVVFKDVLFLLAKLSRKSD